MIRGVCLTRLYLISIDGRVVYAGGRGPQGFRPGELKEAIDLYLIKGIKP